MPSATKLIISGTKKITNELITYQAINEWVSHNKDKYISVIMSGKIKGPESHAAQYAIKNNIFYIEFTPDWDLQEGKAILSRNINMAKDGDELIAIYDGINKSTNHIIDIMLTLNKPVWVYNISNFPLELRRLV